MRGASCAPAELEVTADGEPVAGVVAMQYSPGGDVTGAARRRSDVGDPVEPTEASTSGCEPSDFDGFPEGDVALVQRGTVLPRRKGAQRGGRGRRGAGRLQRRHAREHRRLQGTLVRPGVTIPVVGVGFDDGAALAARPRPAPLGVRVRAESPARDGRERARRDPREGEGVVLLGAHLDSVPRRARHQRQRLGSRDAARDRGGAADAHPEKTIRLAFWDAEELGLHGSTAYVERLSDGPLDAIEAVVNVDMVGSPNGGRFVFDGDGSSGIRARARPGRTRSRTPSSRPSTRSDSPRRPPTSSPQRTDSAPFVEAGIPVGGVFSGADGAKTAAEATSVRRRGRRRRTTPATTRPATGRTCGRSAGGDLARAVALAVARSPGLTATSVSGNLR